MSVPSKPKRGGCSLCGAPVVAEHKPFCSQGCRDRDLLNWLGEAYRTPAGPTEAEMQEIANDGLDTP